MNTFNKKSLYAAVAGLSALGVTGAANAVSVNPDGLGQALVYPYYTVRDQVAGSPYNSLLSVVNSTASAKAVKVRFLEGKNSREVLDFNLYLSAKDVWTAAIIPTSDGGGIFTADKSCTTPTVSSSASSPTLFVNFAYSGSNDDGAGTTLDRTREGYVEIIEMGNVTGATATAVTHVSGVPPCSPLSGASADTVTGNGGLFGGMTLINVLQGTDYTEDAVALDAFSSTPLWNPPGSILPNLANVNPKISVVTTGSQHLHHRLVALGQPGGSGLGRADAQQRVQRVRSGRGDQVGYRLGRDDARRRASTTRARRSRSCSSATSRRPARATTSRSPSTTAKSARWCRRRSSRRRRRRSTDSICWEANVDHVQQLERAGLEEPGQHPVDVPGRLGCAELQRLVGSGRTSHAGRRHVDGVQHRHRHDRRRSA